MTSLLEKYPHIGGVRRRDVRGRLLHACCVCDQLAPWAKGWRWYGSLTEIDDATPVMKFCPKHTGEKLHLAVTVEMAEDARRRECRIE